MTGLDYFTFVVLAVLIGAGLYLAFILGGLPGKIAAQREHPQTDAIRVAGWFGLLTLGILWPLALIWAYTKPGSRRDSAALSDELDALRERLASLEQARAKSPKEDGADS
jgi:hypothetical protein